MTTPQSESVFDELECQLESAGEVMPDPADDLTGHKLWEHLGHRLGMAPSSEVQSDLEDRRKERGCNA